MPITSPHPDVAIPAVSLHEHVLGGAAARGEAGADRVTANIGLSSTSRYKPQLYRLDGIVDGEFPRPALLYERHS